jgi:molybdopterin converting factor small subunit
VATVHFPSGWTEHTGGVDHVVIDVPRVHELIVALSARFPGLTELLEQVAVAIDGQIYHHARYETLSPQSEVHFLPPVAGG